jgi:hypothetical protein
MAIGGVAIALPNTGCPAVGASSRAVFSANVQEQRKDQGTSKFEPPGRTVKGEVWTGTFTAKLTGPAATEAKKLGLKLTAGSFVGKVDATEDYSIGKASHSALELITMKDKKTGSICVKADYATTDHGVTYKGTFQTLGGTGKLAKVKVSGTTEMKPATPGQPGPAAMTGKGSGVKTSKAAALSAECKALVGM